MNTNVREIQVRAVLPLEGTFALFLGNAEKAFVIYIDENVGGAISMFLSNTPKERPLTHDLMANLLMSFGAKVERVVINDMNGAVFYARLILAAENELHSKKLVELDARPSYSVAMALQQGAPIYVADSVWEQVEDVSSTLAKYENEAKHSAAGLTSGDSDDDVFPELFSDEDDDEDEDDEFDLDADEDEDEDFDFDEDDEFDLDDEDEDDEEEDNRRS
jgi:bifunctional DNase/RNase